MYCTVEDVVSDFKNLKVLATGSAVTIDELTEIIDQECAYIHSRICALYEVPVIQANSPTSFAVLKRINIFLASDRVRHILQVKTAVPEKNQETKGSRETMSRDPQRDLKDILKGIVKLGDAVSVNECIGFDVSEEVGDCCTNVFDVNKQQW